MSKRQCEIYFRGGSFYINDLHSTNGTYVNNAMVIKETPLPNGSTVRLGRKSYVITFEVE